jgi:hypothetical protein
MSVESRSAWKFTHEVLDDPERRARVLAELTRLTSSIPEAPPEPTPDAPSSLVTKFSRLARGREQLFRALAGAVFALASGTEMLNDMSDIMDNNRPEAAHILQELQQHVEQKRRKMAEAEEGTQSIRRAA